MAYYDDKVADLRRLFGTEDVIVGNTELRIAKRAYEVVDDVIVLLPPERRPGSWTDPPADDDGAAAVQQTFGREWMAFDRILPEHQREFERYFDLIDLTALANSLVADLGCGIGRYSYFLAASCRRLVLVDFSEAIFVARRNMAHLPSPIFIMGDVTRLPWADDAVDFAFSLGVLHHLQIDALESVRSLRRLTPHLLVYLYYALDNRPAHFRLLLQAVTGVRRRTARLRNERVRQGLTALIAAGVYRPLVALGRLARPLGLDRAVPLAETYAEMSMARIRQDVYDRFFTPIEQRVSRRQIEGLVGDFATVTVSDFAPYWHFDCRR
jgi:SAM-dependent methyltransferase